eukprot:s7586_g1.t2
MQLLCSSLPFGGCSSIHSGTLTPGNPTSNSCNLLYAVISDLAMAPPRSAFPAEGTRFGLHDDSFELGTELGGGSQGRVYACKRLGTGNEYAVKIVNTKAIGLRERTMASLRREISVMRELHHPRIVNLKEAFWEGNLCYIVMDLARGGDLHSKLEPAVGLGSEQSSRHVSLQLLGGIAYMHLHKVIHRDLKPENVLIVRSFCGPEPLRSEMKCSLMTSEPFRESGCGHCLGVLMLLYGLFNTYLFIKFTPVYTATSCGDQTALLKKFEVGDSIHVGVEIHVLCSNPNPCNVKILNDTPGHVYVGKDRGTNVGVLTLLEGSTLPSEGQGTIKVYMDSRISKDSSGTLAEQFLGKGEIPIYLELKFNVGVDISFGLQHFGTTAPFDKKCGMNIGGMFERSQNKLGPMLCRGSFDELGDLPHLGEAVPGEMSFSAAQMDPDRVQMGERLKNIGILGVGGFCYLLGFFMTYTWFQELWAMCQSVPALQRASSRTVSRDGLTGSCMRARSGNLQEPERPEQMPWHRGLLGGLGKDRQRPKRSQLDERSRLISLLSCGMIKWTRGMDGGQPTLTRSESQASCTNVAAACEKGRQSLILNLQAAHRHEVKIADFGLSKCLRRVGEQEAGMTACGTLDYLAPEVVTGQYDERIDFWSFGVLLYIMLSGRLPFEIEGVADIKRLSGESLTFQGAWRSVSEHARSFVQGLLRVDPADRFDQKGCLSHPWLAHEASTMEGSVTCSDTDTSPLEIDSPTEPGGYRHKELFPEPCNGVIDLAPLDKACRPSSAASKMHKLRGNIEARRLPILKSQAAF